MNIKLLAAILLLAFTVPITAQTKRVYIAPDDHTDYMWTGDEEAYRSAFVEMIDYYMIWLTKRRAMRRNTAAVGIVMAQFGIGRTSTTKRPPNSLA